MISSMQALTCPRLWSRTPNILRCGSRRATSTGLEAWCDEFNEPLPALNSFVLPGGSPLSALLHVARTVARRAERSAWLAVDTHGESISVLPAKYLNRLSDLLFILSRVANPDGDVLVADPAVQPQQVRTCGVALEATVATPARTRRQ